MLLRDGTRQAIKPRAMKSAIALLALVLMACSEVPVLQGVPEREANRAIAALDQAGVAARKEADESGGSGPAQFRVVVGPDEVARSVTVLQSHGLPAREEPGFAESYGTPSLVQTATEERARSAQSIAGELARTIESIDGVLDARVHVSLPAAEDRPLDDREGPRPTASVLLRYVGAHAPYDETALKRLVAGSVVGMRAEDVTVVAIARPLPTTNAETRLSYVGPIAVARGSAPTLRAVLAGTIGFNVLLAVALIVSIVRRRKPEGEGDDQAEPAKK